MSKREIILAAATRLFSRNGFKETSMAELSKITGAAGGTIFHHFRNKEDLFLNILKDVQETVTSAFGAQAEKNRSDSGMERVEKAVLSYLQLAETFEDQFLLIHRHYPYQMAETSPQCRGYLELVYNCLLDIFEECILEGISDGTISIPPTISSPRSAAMVIFAMVDGITRLNTYKIYHAGALYKDVVQSCRSLLTKTVQEPAQV